MGAEMALASLGFKADERFELDQKAATAALAQARRAIKALDRKRFTAINNDLCGEYENLAEYRRVLRGDVAAIKAAITGQCRDAAFITGGPGIVLLISGGPSWGDPPTELYESIGRLCDADLMPDARWPKKP
jgi:hypothetical protein